MLYLDGKNSLPGLAFNTYDERQLPFPEDLILDVETITVFCSDFLTGKLQKTADSRRTLMSRERLHKQTKQKNNKGAPKMEIVFQSGILENFAFQPLLSITALKTANDFNRVVLDAKFDVVVLFYTQVLAYTS